MASTNPTTPARIATTIVVVALLAAAAAVPAAAGQHEDDRAFVVALHEDGSATVAVTLAFDLTSDSERAAFEQLRTNDTVREGARARFLERMRTVAATASEATGREMSVSDARVAIDTADDGETGLVELSVTWEGLAAVEDGRLVVTEPFASGFEPDRPFTVRGPDGYELASASPAPSTEGGSGTRAAWAPGTSLDGFEVVFAPADAGTPTPTPEGQTGGGTGVGGPGFGVGVAVVALLAAAALARRR